MHRYAENPMIPPFCVLFHVLIPDVYVLQYLYLEGNRLSDIPGSFFASLPGLLWLDLRNNQIASLPAQIGSHR